MSRAPCIESSIETLRGPVREHRRRDLVHSGRGPSPESQSCATSIGRTHEPRNHGSDTSSPRTARRPKRRTAGAGRSLRGRDGPCRLTRSALPGRRGQRRNGHRPARRNRPGTGLHCAALPTRSSRRRPPGVQQGSWRPVHRHDDIGTGQERHVPGHGGALLTGQHIVRGPRAIGRCPSRPLPARSDHFPARSRRRRNRRIQRAASRPRVIVRPSPDRQTRHRRRRPEGREHEQWSRNRRTCRACPEARLDTHEFRIEDWLVQPARNRMVRGDTAVRVRPQLIDVLACLAACPGKVVSKDQLLTEVWSDRFVAESGVARCVAELRQLLADDARQPRIIETISKRGYRLIAPVEWLAPSGPASAVRSGGTWRPGRGTTSRTVPAVLRRATLAGDGGHGRRRLPAGQFTTVPVMRSTSSATLNGGPAHDARFLP